MSDIRDNQIFHDPKPEKDSCSNSIIYYLEKNQYVQQQINRCDSGYPQNHDNSDKSLFPSDYLTMDQNRGDISVINIRNDLVWVNKKDSYISAEFVNDGKSSVIIENWYILFNKTKIDFPDNIILRVGQSVTVPIAEMKYLKDYASKTVGPYNKIVVSLSTNRISVSGTEQTFGIPFSIQYRDIVGNKNTKNIGIFIHSYN